MDYFRQKLLSYSTQREMSTLLHIHVQADKAKVLVPISKAKNYVDEILNDYTIKMYTYPELSANDSRLAFNIYSQRKQWKEFRQLREKDLGREVKDQPIVFQLQQSKRKPLKKKIIKKVVVPPIINECNSNYKQCQCCGVKFASKHKCQHIFCEKPCARIKKIKNSDDVNSKRYSKNKQDAEDDEQFAPQKSFQNEDSKYSNQQESDYEQEMDISNQVSESFISGISKTKRGGDKNKGRRKVKRNDHRFRKNVKNRTFHRNTMNKKQSNSQRVLRTQNDKFKQTGRQTVKQKQTQKVQNLDNYEKANNLNQINNENIRHDYNEKNVNKVSQPKVINQFQRFPEISIKRRRSGKKRNHRKRQKQSQQNVQSQFQPNQQKKRRGFKKSSIQSQKQGSASGVVNPQSNEKMKKKQSLSFFCSLDQLKQNNVFNIKIMMDSQQNQNENQLQSQRKRDFLMRKQKKITNIRKQSSYKQQKEQTPAIQKQVQIKQKNQTIQQKQKQKLEIVSKQNEYNKMKQQQRKEQGKQQNHQQVIDNGNLMENQNNNHNANKQTENLRVKEEEQNMQQQQEIENPCEQQQAPMKLKQQQQFQQEGQNQQNLGIEDRVYQFEEQLLGNIPENNENQVYNNDIMDEKQPILQEPNMAIKEQENDNDDPNSMEDNDQGEDQAD